MNTDRRASRPHPFAVALLSAALAWPVAPPPAHAQAQNSLPALGDAVSQDFDLGTERRLGDRIMRDIRRDPDYLDDPVLLEYLQAMWRPLLAQARQRGDLDTEMDQRFAWEVFLVRDRSVNAFALPGGYVGVHLGLIAMTTAPGELASVLAHELSHVTQRHIARSIANSKRQSMIGLAAMILGALAASRSGDAANALITGGQAAAIQGQLNFSRDMEREADRIGFGVMTGAGYPADGMAAMFEKLEQASHLNDRAAFPYLRTHPLSSERIGEARARAGSGQRAASVGLLEHAAAQARARVLMDPRTDALRRWQGLDADRTATTRADKLMAAYASALASTLLRDWSRADASLASAQTLARGDAAGERAVALLLAQSLLARGEPARALDTLRPYTGADASRPVMLLQAAAALAPGQPDADLVRRSAESLQTWAAVHPQDSATWSLLAQTWERLGQPLRSVRADAESRAALGDMSGAADRLRAAQRMARSGSQADFIEASVIDARLREVEVRRREQAAEERTGG